MASLRDAQRDFAAALVTTSAASRVEPPENLAVYRNNAAHAFGSALASSFPVLKRRVGEDYFRQLGALYREGFPSRSGDLHWVGKDFAAFLKDHLSGGDYQWLADLARLEWARELASIASELPALEPAALASVPADRLEHIRFTLQPSLQLIASPYPVFSVWLANQAPDATPVDQSRGSEQGLVRIRRYAVEVEQLTEDRFRFLNALSQRMPMGDAVDAAGLDPQKLSEVLGFIFNSDLVTGIDT